MSSGQEERFLDSVGKRLAKLRNEKSLTQEQLAAKSGVDWKHIGFIEQGRMRPTVRTVYRLAKGLKVPADQLLKDL